MGSSGPRAGDRDPQPDRLIAALQRAEEFESSQLTRAEFIAAHPELSDLLEVMLPEPQQATGKHESERIGDFELLRLLGRGGIGEVFEAVQLSVDRRVALKRLHNWSPDERALARFQREARLCALVAHPCIVRIILPGFDGQRPFLAMELVPGVPLARVIKSLTPSASADQYWAALDRELTALGFEASAEERARRPLDSYPRLIASLIARLADALEQVHRAGIVHRDVKPANVLVRGDGCPVLTDFGIARRQGALGLTLTGEPMGTPYYQAPETHDGPAAAVDARADVFSLGVSLYEALTLTRPFDGETVSAVAEQILHVRPVEPRRREPRIDRDLNSIVLKALEKDPADRFATARELALELERWLRGESVATRPTPRWRRVVRWVRHNRLPSAVGLALAASAAGLVFAFAQRSTALRDVETLRMSVRRAGWSTELASLTTGKGFSPWSPPARAQLQRLRDLIYATSNEAPRVEAAAEATADAEMQTLLHDLARNLRADRAWGAYLDRLMQAHGETADGPRWSDVRASVAAALDCSREYLGTVLPESAPADLLPLRISPFGLWEFWHPGSGKRPTPGADGKWSVDRDTGIVFALIPANAELPAYLIAVHELTQGQWQRLVAPGLQNPSLFSEHRQNDALLGTDPDTHPVESISAALALRVLRPWGLDLPTDVEWQRAAHGRGTWAPTDPSQLIAYCNLADSAMRQANLPFEADENLYDDWHVHAPVGSYRPNDYGLFDVLGNVMELVLRADQSSPPPSSLRGGSYSSLPAACSLTTFRTNLNDAPYSDIGCRPVRRL